jgi:outer membrane lipoprotein carrier protein
LVRNPSFPSIGAFLDIFAPLLINQHANMKKLILGCFVLSFWATWGYGQNNSLGQSDPDAKKILDAFSNKIKTFKGIQATFTLKIEDSQSKLQGVKKGTAYVLGNKYKIAITGQEIYCDGNTVWTYDKSSNEVTITKVDPSVNPIQKMFTNFYDKDFLYKLNGEQKMDGRLVQEIEMTPVDKTKSIFKIYAYVDKAKGLMYSVKTLDKNGNKYTYTINTLNGKAVLSDSIFVFDKTKYPGVEEVDLRE